MLPIGKNSSGSTSRQAARWRQSMRSTPSSVELAGSRAAGLFRKIGRSTPTMIGFIVVDGIVLITCLRFVGIPGDQIGYLAVMAGLLSLYPLTIFPFAGLGVLDAALIVLINAEGVADSADLIAAMVIWRTATLLLPLLPGLAAITAWRRNTSSVGDGGER